MIFHIAMRELRSLFLSPLAWTTLAIMQFILAWLFLSEIQAFFKIQPQLALINNTRGATDLVVTPLFFYAGNILLVVTPLMTMRLFSDELRSGSFRLLLSSPLSMTEIIFGKYLGILLFMIFAITLISLMPISLYMGTDIDIGQVTAAIFGTVLLASTFSAIGLFFSTLTTNPVIASLSTFGTLIFLWIIGFTSANENNLFTYLSPVQHFISMLKGFINSTDVIYFSLISIMFISISIRQLDSQRLQK